MHKTEEPGKQRCSQYLNLEWRIVHRRMQREKQYDNIEELL